MERDPLLARVLARELGRRHVVVVVRDVTAAVRELTGHTAGAFDVVVANYQLGRGPSGAFLSRIVARRWPTLRRVLYVDSSLPAPSNDGGEVVIEMPGDFDSLLKAIESPAG